MRKFLFFIGCVFFLSNSAIAAVGDTILVQTHNNVLIQTNPAIGHTEYPGWGVFPSAATQYNKVLLKLSFKCPTGKHCGEWDYGNHIYLRRVGGVNGTDQEIELARMITPYGWNFNSTWKFDWYLDVTDFALLLHDSVEVEYRHSGYEAQNDRGWVINVSFIGIEGTPAATPVKIEKIYNGSFNYGKTADPIEDHLQPIQLTADTATELMRFRLNLTGHGMESTENCAEFCEKQCQYLWDSQQKHSWQVWRQCGANPLYPQAGTWVYNRTNWCPGEIVFPHIYDFNVAKGSNHWLDVDMESFTMNDQSQSANFVFGSVMIHYKKPNFNNEIAITDILAPSSETYNGRLNPICANPKIKIRNEGNNPLTAAVISYGIENEIQYIYHWKGNLAFWEEAEVDLPNLFVNTFTDPANKFYAEVSWPNAQPDENSVNNRMTSKVSIPPVYDSILIFKIKANNDNSETSYTLKDDLGNILYQRAAGSMAAMVTNTDTFRLPDGCYELTVNDIGGDGLSWWANTAGGNGSAVLYRGNNSLLKTLNPDFGSITQWRFMVGNPFLSIQNGINDPEADYLFDVYPNPANNTITVDMAHANATTATVALYDITGKVIFSEKTDNNTYHHLPISTAGINNGIYVIKVTTAFSTKTKTVVIAH